MRTDLKHLKWSLIKQGLTPDEAQRQIEEVKQAEKEAHKLAVMKEKEKAREKGKEPKIFILPPSKLARDPVNPRTSSNYPGKQEDHPFSRV